MNDENTTTPTDDDTEGHMPRVRIISDAETANDADTKANAEPDDAEGHMPRIKLITPAETAEADDTKADAEPEDAEGHADRPGRPYRK